MTTSCRIQFCSHDSMPFILTHEDDYIYKDLDKNLICEFADFNNFESIDYIGYVNIKCKHLFILNNCFYNFFHPIFIFIRI